MLCGGTTGFGSAKHGSRPRGSDLCLADHEWLGSIQHSFLEVCKVITIKKVVPEGTCVFCDKQKEVVAVVMDGGTAEVMLCWADVKKHAQMRMRMNGTAPEKKPE